MRQRHEGNRQNNCDRKTITTTKQPKMKEPNCSLLRLSKVAIASMCLLATGVVVQAQPTITIGYPNGTNLFQPANAMTFTAKSVAAITNVSVQLTATSLSGYTLLSIYSIGSGVSLSGPANNPTASVALSTNLMYSAYIQVVDAYGLSSSTTVNFDTISPVYTWEAEDWDYNNGHYINNPQTNQYAGLASVSGVDYNNASPGSGNASYRPQGMETEQCSDTPRLAYLGGGNTNKDYDVGYSTSGGFANYTRNFPPGVYNIYARLANGSGSGGISSVVNVAETQDGTAQLIGDGQLNFIDTQTGGWQVYQFFPLVDDNNALVQFTNDGTATTLQILTVNQGAYNANFYMLMPVVTNQIAAGPTITPVYPDGALQFEATNFLTFTVSSTNGIAASNVLVRLSAVTLVGKKNVQVYNQANGLVASGDANTLTVAVPLQTNMNYTVFIQAADNNGNPSGKSLTFDTIQPLYTWEASDYDFQGGQFIDNPQTNLYATAVGLFGIDFYVDNPVATEPYRSDSAPGGAHFENCGDTPRAPFYNTGNQMHDIGNNDGPNWFNYTRDYPPGTYNVYVRYANGGGGPGGMSFGIVTGGVGTSNQTLVNLGSWALPPTPGWGTFAPEGLTDANGNLLKLTITGKETFRAYNLSSLNFEYFMLMPVDTSVPVFQGVYPNGQYFFQGTNTLAFSVSSSDGINTNAIDVSINGEQVTDLIISGSSTNWHVRWPHLQPNTNYSATLSVTSLAGNTKALSITFDTYAGTDYQWESADYDATSNGVPGIYFDTGVDQYANLTATPGVDEAENTAGAPISEDVYRVDPGGALLICTQSGGDKARVQFGNNPTWRINWFGYGDFANYTRHYPKGKYYVMARYTEGGGASAATLWKVTAGYKTANQTTSFLGTFPMALGGWNLWDWTTLVDSNNVPVTVSFDGSLTTLQLQGPVADDGQTSNVGFFLLVPVLQSGPTVTAVRQGSNIQLSFSTTTGTSYQVQYTGSLVTPIQWTNLGAAIPGNNATQMVTDTIGTGPRFYRVEAQ